MEYVLIFVIYFEICQFSLINMPDKQIWRFIFISVVTKLTFVLHFYYYYWFDSTRGGQIVVKGIIRLEISVSAMAFVLQCILIIEANNS